VIRSLICPFDQIEPFVPRQGKILDFGCGHGIFSALLVKKSLNRKVLGIDPSEHKIKLAQKHYNGIKNLQFKKAYLKDVKRVKYDCIVIIDVLYLLSNKAKLKTLNLAKKLLNKNGVLILKTISHNPKWLFTLVKLEEKLMVKILKYTYSDTLGLYFLSEEKYQQLLNKAGFTIIDERLIQGIPYRQQLIIAKKTISSSDEK